MQTQKITQKNLKIFLHTISSDISYAHVAKQAKLSNTRIAQILDATFRKIRLLSPVEMFEGFETKKSYYQKNRNVINNQLYFLIAQKKIVIV